MSSPISKRNTDSEYGMYAGVYVLLWSCEQKRVSDCEERIEREQHKVAKITRFG